MVDVTAMTDAIALFTLVVKAAFPYALAFAIGNLIVNAFMRMAFGGRIEF